MVVLDLVRLQFAVLRFILFPSQSEWRDFLMWSKPSIVGGIIGIIFKPAGRKAIVGIPIEIFLDALIYNTIISFDCNTLLASRLFQNLFNHLNYTSTIEKWFHRWRLKKKINTLRKNNTASLILPANSSLNLLISSAT